MTYDKNKNLKPFDSNQSREEAKKNGQKGGIKSGEARRERKQMKEHLLLLLSEGKIQENILLSMINEATEKGNVKAAEFIRDTLGEKPKEQIENDIEVKITRKSI